MIYKKTAETLKKGANSLDRDYYINPEILNNEYENIFLKNWVCAGRTSELINQGKFKVMNLGSESAIILRYSKNELKAFTNICRHRGTRICEKNKGKFSNAIQCGYHGWTYSLDGKLIGAPHMDSIENFDKNDYPLFPIGIAEWEGFIFINFNDNPESFEKSFSPIFNKFTNWNLSQLFSLETKTYKVKANWKLIIQNYSECYHCPIIHPELSSITPYLSGRNDLFEGSFLGGYMNFKANKESITSSGKLCCPPIRDLNKDDLDRVYYYSISPNMLLSLHPEYVMYHTVLPINVDSCEIRCSWLFEKNVVISDSYNTKEAIDFWDKTNKQDWKICEMSQLGIQSKKYSPAPYSSQESLLAAFDKNYKLLLNKK
ncbi:MAG: (2Fe-2S)-binding protein [Candidatus Marinimicrobia bacterium]|nr:(2Fe-2S)-binding protein [Candidatus Neomarinimicrobiota bacterium]|tara:strand:- start:4028 stop:5146 length:1119 start_codon:yes stop_codon:yes gene_type:complete